MATFQFELVSPEKLLLSADADSVTVPGTEGEFTVLPGHAPFMSTIKPGILSVTSSSKTDEYILFGGFAEVGSEGLTILAEEAQPRADVDLAKIDQSIKDLEEDLADASGDDAKSQISQTLEHMKTLRSLAA